MKDIHKIFNDKKYKTKTLLKRKCEKCGHSIDYISLKDFTLCTWCGAKIYKNEKIKFRYELEKRLR